ncbi:MAG: Hsp33 family molecular chaperone HslO [Chloroflexi bacterium]|nr:MAG: Hsp33 family molecular chaperone HslO [Chloroflexota bacterium]PIE81330.1 MAG: Hsp33 family molecular chaperone HslO [Chloroflexota bacterium]
MEDYLIRIIAKETGVRGLACVTTHLANEAAARHETTPTTTVVLERTLTSGILAGALLKVGQRVALKFEGDGPVGKAIAEADAYGRIRGYVVHPEVDLPLVDGKADIVNALGVLGSLSVVKDVKLKEMPEGVVPLISSTFDGDFTYYLNQSEQTPSLVVIAEVLAENGRLQVSGGVLIQAMPPNDVSIIRQFIERMQDLPPLEVMLAGGKSPEAILAELFAGIAYEKLEKRPLRFKCACSRERSEKALINLGKDGLQNLLETEGEAVVDCHFCHEQYIFDAEDLRLIMASMI